MMDKMSSSKLKNEISFEEQLKKHRIIAILRKLPFNTYGPVTQALYDGGIRLFEITFDENRAGEILSVLKTSLPPDVYIGAGTLLTAVQSLQAIHHGADFLVSPVISNDVAYVAQKHRLPFIIGAMTPTEMFQALRLGTTFIKLFPAASFTPQYMHEVKGPLPHVQFVPTGGLNLEGAKRFLNAGALAIGSGSQLIQKQWLIEKRYDLIKEEAKQWVNTLFDGPNVE